MRKKVGIITLGITLILCGAAIILVRYTDWKFTDIFLLWPAFLILLGLEFIFTKLWHDLRKHEVNLSPSGISIFLAIVIILVSSVWINNGTLQPNWIWNINLSGNLPDIFKESAEGSFSLEKDALPDVDKIIIDNEIGSIEVLPSENDRFKLDAQISVSTNDKEAALKLIDQIITVVEGKEMRIRSNDAQLNRKHSLKYVNMKLWLPKDIEVQISTGFGQVLLKDMENDVTIRQQHSDVVLSNIKGNVNIDCSFGNINVKKVEGDAIVKNAHGKVSIEEISGKAQVENSFNSTDAKQIGKDLFVISKHGKVNAEYISGKAVIENEFAEVSCSNVEGSVEVVAKHSKLNLSDIKGDIDAETSYDGIRLSNTTFENADIKASTTYGPIISDDEVGLKIRKEGSLEEASAQNGSANQKIRLKCQHGEIRINMK